METETYLLAPKSVLTVQKETEDALVKRFNLEVFNGIVTYLQTNKLGYATPDILLEVVKGVLQDPQIKKVNVVRLFRNNDERMDDFLPLTRSALQLFVNAQKGNK